MSEEKKTVRKNIVGENIRQMRTRLAISQKQLAALLNEDGLPITSCTLCKIENGTRGITDIELWRLAKLFHVSVDDFFENAESYLEQCIGKDENEE